MYLDLGLDATLSEFRTVFCWVYSLLLSSRARWNPSLIFSVDTAGLSTESFAGDLDTDLLGTDLLGMEPSHTTGTAARYPCGTRRI